MNVQYIRYTRCDSFSTNPGLNSCRMPFHGTGLLQTCGAHNYISTSTYTSIHPLRVIRGNTSEAHQSRITGTHYTPRNANKNKHGSSKRRSPQSWHMRWPPVSSEEESDSSEDLGWVCRVEDCDLWFRSLECRLLKKKFLHAGLAQSFSCFSHSPTKVSNCAKLPSALAYLRQTSTNPMVCL